MRTLTRANKCGTCRGVHGDAPAGWPTCPTCGHWLKERLDKTTPDGYVYGCLGCKYTQIQRERITMTTDQAAGAALALRDGQGYWDERQLAALKQLGIKDVTKADLQVFLHYCQRTGLDPFSKQIYMIARKAKERVQDDQGRWVEQYVSKQTIQVGIDGLRVIAQRAAKRDGVTLSYGPTKWYDDDGKSYGVWVQSRPPAAASVTIYRDGNAFPGVVRFSSFADFDNQGNLRRQWATMPDHLIAKCAEAQALRKAFPHDLESLYITDETGHTERVPIAHREPRAEPVQVYSDAAQPPVQGPRGDDAAPSAADWIRLEAQWKRLGITDPEERDIYLCKLASKDHRDQVTTGDVALALDVLKGCEDIGALNDECAVEAS